jgi:hypothetical protein
MSDLTTGASSSNVEEIKMDLSDEVKVVTTNYEVLKNLPSINKHTLIGNYDEIDPTVPIWAKSDLKPSYTPDEIGALDIRNEISFSDIKEMWDNVFK